MPHCFVVNCKNRTGYTFSKIIRYYSFPRNPKLRSKWLAVCQKDKNHEITHERICEIHFSSDCIEHKMTKSRSTHIAKVVYKLKIGSVSTEFLDLPSKRRKLLYFSEKRNDQEAGSSKKSICSGIPTYSELVGCIKNNFEEDSTLKSIDDIESTTSELVGYTESNFEEDSTLKSIDDMESTTSELVGCTESNFEEDTTLKSIDDMESTTITERCNINTSVAEDTTNASVTEENASMENIDSEKLFTILKQVLNENEQLTQTNLQLQTKLQEKCNIIETMQKDMEECGNKIATDILQTVFTPGQVKRFINKNY